MARNEGVTEALRKAFLVYLVSHPRPIEELLEPNWKQQDALFESEFRGMAFSDVALPEMLGAVKGVLEEMLAGLDEAEKRFLCGLYEGEADGKPLGLDHVEAMPAVKWKVRNVARMGVGKRAASLGRLKEILGVE